MSFNLRSINHMRTIKAIGSPLSLYSTSRSSSSLISEQCDTNLRRSPQVAPSHSNLMVVPLLKLGVSGLGSLSFGGNAIQLILARSKTEACASLLLRVRSLFLGVCFS